MASASIIVLGQNHLHSSLFDDNISVDDLMGRNALSFMNDEIRLRNEVYECFLRMREAAKADGIEIVSVSAYRSFDHQQSIWNRKYKSYTESGLSPEESIQKIIEYSTMPGTSRHHWGTDIDIIDGSVPQPENVLSPQHFEGDGPFVKLKKWLDKNANEFGFYLVYTNNPNRMGFKYEPWHYSYKPLSKKFLDEYKSQRIIDKVVTKDMLGGSYVSKDFLKTYYKENILDINPELL